MDQTNQTKNTSVSASASASATPLKKYRISASSYDNYDKIYADQVRRIFYYIVPETQQISFNEYTDDLIQDTYISRHKLLDAIDDYYACKGSQLLYMFTDSAFNCRPYQI